MQIGRLLWYLDEGPEHGRDGPRPQWHSRKERERRAARIRAPHRTAPFREGEEGEGGGDARRKKKQANSSRRQKPRPIPGSPFHPSDFK